jgi:hypothetical protein
MNAKALILEVVNERLERGQPTVNENMAVVPLLTKHVVTPEYVLLQEAIEQGLAEVKEGGSVSELILENRGEKPVLIVQGQELISGSQHRQSNATILAPKGRTTIPVSCIEAGRGLSVGAAFHVGNVVVPSVRHLTSWSVSRSLRSGRGYRAEQGEVWSEIIRSLNQYRASSPTSAHHAIYQSLTGDEGFKRFKAKFMHGDTQVGAIILINHEVVALEAFDSPDTWHSLHESIVNAYAAHAYASREKKNIDEEALDGKLVDFAVKLADMEVSTHPGAGLGENSRIKLAGFTGEALTHEDELIHLVIMKSQEPPRESERPRTWETRVSREPWRPASFRRELYRRAV